MQNAVFQYTEIKKIMAEKLHLLATNAGSIPGRYNSQRATTRSDPEPYIQEWSPKQVWPRQNLIMINRLQAPYVYASVYFPSKNVFSSVHKNKKKT